MNKSLQEKLKSYSVLTTAFASVASVSTNAGVIYDPIVYTGTCTEQYDIDVDGNGVFDFSMVGVDLTNVYTNYAVLNVFNLAIQGNSEVMADPNDYYNMLNLNSGQMIGNTQSFNAGGLWCGPYNMNGGALHARGVLPNGDITQSWGVFDGIQSTAETDGYIGLSFEIDGAVHYGWMRMAIYWTGTFRLLGMAYNCTPGEPLAAGDTGDQMATTPTMKNGSTILSNGETLYSCTLGGDVDLAINTGTLNDADDWVWYEGSTSGTVVGTGTSVTVSPSVPTTYVVRAESCGVSYSSITSVNIDVTSINATVFVSSNIISSNEGTSGATYQWVDCDNGNAPIPSATNRIFNAGTSGNYAVEVTLNGCTVTSSCTILNFVGIEDNEVSLVKVSPNPAKDVLTFKLNETYVNASVQIFDLTGKVLKEIALNSNSLSLDISEFNSGVYLAKINSTRGAQTIKFIKE